MGFSSGHAWWQRSVAESMDGWLVARKKRSRNGNDAAVSTGLQVVQQTEYLNPVV
jgi:hypothetical protein